MRSRAHQRQGLFGVEAADQHRAQTGGTWHEHPVEQSGIWAIGAGIRTASAGPSPCTRAINDAFQLSPRWVCRTALGIPVDPDVKRTNATSEGALGSAPAGTGHLRPPPPAPQGRRTRRARISRTRAGSIWPRAAATSGRAERVQHGSRHGTDAPAGPGQDGGGQAVGHLPGHGLARVARPGRAARRPPWPRARRPRRPTTGCSRRPPRRRAR